MSPPPTCEIGESPRRWPWLGLRISGHPKYSDFFLGVDICAQVLQHYDTSGKHGEVCKWCAVHTSKVSDKFKGEFCAQVHCLAHMALDHRVDVAVSVLSGYHDA